MVNSRLVQSCLKEQSTSDTHRNWLVWLDQQWRQRSPGAREFVAGFFRPTRVERHRNGLIYRLIGIQVIAYLIPTGGLFWRRLFHWKGWSFALQGNSLRKAREYRYNTCVFEVLHATGFLLMIPDAVRAVSRGYTDGIIHFLVVGVLINGYPWMLQRYNRVRIANLLERHQIRVRRRTERTKEPEA